MDHRGIKSLPALLDYLKQPETDAILRQLEAAHRAALPKLLAADYEVDVKCSAMSLLLYKLVVLNQYLKQDLYQEPVFKEALDFFIKTAVQRGELIHPGLAIYYAKHAGYASLPLESIDLAPFLAESTSGDDVMVLIDGLYHSRPDEFREFFTRYLEKFADDLDEQAKTQAAFKVEEAALNLFGGLKTKRGPWYNYLIKFVKTDAARTERTNAALERIKKYLPKDVVKKWAMGFEWPDTK